MGVNILQFGKRRTVLFIALAATIAVVVVTLSINNVFSGNLWGNGSQNDVIKPIIVVTSISNPSFGIDGTRTITVTGTASDNSEVASVHLKSDVSDMFLPAQKTSGSWAKWTIEMNVPFGANAVTAKVVDVNGNEAFNTMLLQKPPDDEEENENGAGVDDPEPVDEDQDTDEGSTPVVIVPNTLISEVTDGSDNPVTYGSTIHSKSITFRLSSPEKNQGVGLISFEGSLDNGPFTPVVTNPMTIPDLDFGTHTFMARAIHVPSNATDNTPIIFTWRVLPPVLSSEDALVQIETVDANGIPFRGIFATIRNHQSGEIFNGYTPIFYVGSKSTIYTVTVHDFQDRFFQKWQDGTTSRSITFALNRQNEALVSATYGDLPAVESVTQIKRSTGLYVPLYAKPDVEDRDGVWNSIIEAKKMHPQVPFLITINPASGPGEDRDLMYAKAIRELKDAGVENILGYIPTDYGSQGNGRTLADLKGMIDSYRIWYKEVNGIMFDEVSSSGSDIGFYDELIDYARSSGFTIIRGNPGTEINEGYLAIFDNLSIYENNVRPDLRTLVANTYHPEYPKAKFSFVASGVEELDAKYLIAAREYVGYFYMTDDEGIIMGQNPYDSVSRYFDQLVSLLDVSDI
jgi:spherulation-specific family 4 protein